MTTSAQPDSPAASVAPTVTAAPTARPRRRSIASAILTEPGLWLLLYLVGLAFVAFWPTRIERPADEWLDAVTAAIPWLTLARIEFTANILLFVPFGFLFVATLRGRPLIALLIAIAVSIGIETGQALFLVERDTTIRDVLANTIGAGIGIVLALIVTRTRRRRR